MAAHRQACFIDILSVHHGIGTGKINILKGADPEAGRLFSIHRAMDAVIINSYNFSGKDIADKFRVNRIKGRRFRTKYITAFCLAQRHRTIAEGIPESVNCLIGTRHNGICAADFIHDALDPVLHHGCSCMGKEFDNDLRIHGGLESRSALKESVSENFCIHQIPVVGKSQRPFRAFQLQRLDIARNGRSRRAVPHMTDAYEAFLFGKFAEDFRDKTHAAECFHRMPVADSYSRAFLPAVLQRKNPVICFKSSRPVSVINGKNPAFFMKLVIADSHIPVIHFQNFSPVRSS